MHNHHPLVSKDFMKISLRKSANILKIVAVAALLFATGVVKAQCPPALTDITAYNFSTGVGSSADWLTPSSSTQIVSSGIDDGAGSLCSLGFTFTFEQNPYTQISANTNGNLRLGSSVIAASPYSSPLNASNVISNNPKIIGIGKDLSSGAAGGVWYGVVGSAPNRIGVIRFQENYTSSSSGTDYLNWQVQLYEATGEIKIVYNTYVSTPSGFQIGIVGASTSNVVTINPSTHVKTNGASDNTYSTWPGQYRYYSFTPPSVRCPSVYNLSQNGNLLTWIECGTATRWIVEYGPIGFTPGSGTTVVVNNTPQFDFSSFANGIYQFNVRAYCGVGDTSAVVSTSIAKGYSYCGGNGTQANPYLICTEADLRDLSSAVNQGVSYANTYFRVQNDIAMVQGAFTPIGATASTPFRGHFDGNNKTISGLSVTGYTQYRGLFGYVAGTASSARAEIHHLTVRGSVSGGSYTGGIVGYATNCNLYNLTNYATFNSGYSYRGGIAGAAYDNCRIDSCYNYADVPGSQYVGGIVGQANEHVNFSNVANFGNVNSTSAPSYVGGIVGYHYNNGSINNAVNNGNVTASGYNVGGIVGYQYNNNSIRNSRNNGNVSSTYTSYVYLGGIAGYQYNYDTIYNCHNTGNISSTYYYVGGLVGYKYQYGFISNSTNTGLVNGSYYIGGIAGYVNSYNYINNCRNAGDVTGTA